MRYVKCQGHPGTWLWVTTPGVREMLVADPEGNILRMAGPTKR